MSTVVASQYGATTGAAKSLIAQLHPQGKLTTPRRANRNIRHENEILKANERFHKMKDERSIDWYQNIHAHLEITSH
jgi:hypothetical protein